MDDDDINLPSIEELAQLTRQALGVYAARAALRASVFLCAKHTLKDIWPKDTPRHSTALLGVWVFLRHVWSDAGTPNVKKNRDSLAADAARAAASASAYAADAARAAAAYAAFATYTNAIYTNTNANAAADAAIAAAADAATLATNANARAARAARADYVFLLQNPKDESAIWAQVPLWQGFEAKSIATWQQGYLQELSGLGLDFLQDDARYAWGLTGSEAPSQEYLQTLDQRLQQYAQLWQLSKAEHLDAATLKRILGGDTHAQGSGLTSLNAVRVVLVGPGGAGKTALNHLLHTGKPLSQSSPASLAIDHKPIPDQQLQHLLSLAKEPALDQLKLSTWDFAGQTLFYGLHQAFLHENCVYVLVVDNRHEQAPDAWLAQIDYVLRGQGAKSRSVPVLIVTNEYEGLATKQNQNRLIREYPHLLSEDSFFYFSCLKNSGHDYNHFIQSLLSECLNSQHTVFTGTLQAMEAIQKKFEDGVVILKSQELRLILQAALAEKDKATVNISQIAKLKNTLKGLGVIVPIDTQSVIDPNKVVSASYQLLCDDSLKEEMENNNGGISEDWLEELLSLSDAQPAYKAIELETLTDFLSKRGLCFKRENAYVFPDALTEQEHPDATAVYKKPDAEESHFQLRMHYDLDFLPFGLNGQLIQAAFKQYPQKWLKTEYLWRDGLMLQNGSAKAVLQLNKHKTRIDLTLRGDRKDDKTFLEFKSLLGKTNTLVCTVIGESQRVTPFIEIDNQLIALSPANLNGLLNNVHQLENLVARIKEGSKVSGQVINNNFGPVGNLQQNNGDNNQNTQTNITFTPREGQDWQKVLEVFSKTELGQNLSGMQKEQLQNLLKTSQKQDGINKLPERQKSMIQQVLAKIPKVIRGTKNAVELTTFCISSAEILKNIIQLTPLSG